MASSSQTAHLTNGLAQPFGARLHLVAGQQREGKAQVAFSTASREEARSRYIADTGSLGHRQQGTAIQTSGQLQPEKEATTRNIPAAGIRQVATESGMQCIAL